MDKDLGMRRRMLLRCYHRVITADLAWQRGVEEAATWFPKARHSHLMALGNPGSRIRRLYELRARAIAQLETARGKLRSAEARAARRRVRPVLLLERLREV